MLYSRWWFRWDQVSRCTSNRRQPLFLRCGKVNRANSTINSAALLQWRRCMAQQCSNWRALSSSPLRIVEYRSWPAKAIGNGDQDKNATTADGNLFRKNTVSRVVYESSPDAKSWHRIDEVCSDSEVIDDDKDCPPRRRARLSDLLHQNGLIHHFLPARYPTSVATGYDGYASYSFAASVAGSAGMVLSTQTLLLAVGVVGGAGASNTAPIMAGALNWILKDGVGQLGGVLFASSMGRTRHFDLDPKRWRMVAAMALDAASLMEIMSPLCTTTLVLPLACAANIFKNVGFLTAGASRAALHQSLARDANLGDVTGKFGSQSLAAGLVGTAIGIGLSKALGHDPNLFIGGFVATSALHLVGNYRALQHVGLNTLNRQRMYLLLEGYVQHGTVLSANDLSTAEVFVPWRMPCDGRSWLRIGSSLPEVCPGGPADLQELFTACHRSVLLPSAASSVQHIVSVDFDEKNAFTVHLVFLRGASGKELLLGMLHAMLLRQAFRTEVTSNTSGHRISATDLIARTGQDAQHQCVLLEQRLLDRGWTLNAHTTHIEPARAHRLEVQNI